MTVLPLILTLACIFLVSNMKTFVFLDVRNHPVLIHCKRGKVNLLSSF